jgi:hypothetical protein
MGKPIFLTQYSNTPCFSYDSSTPSFRLPCAVDFTPSGVTPKPILPGSDIQNPVRLYRGALFRKCSPGLRESMPSGYKIERSGECVK